MLVKKELLSSSLVKEIQRRISTNEFATGDRLPPQDELAAMFGVSRTALREALKQLSMIGLIEVKHGKGTFVRSFTPSALLESLFPQVLMDRETTLDLLEARLYLETTVAFLAAKKADSKDIKELETLVNGMKKDVIENRIESFIEEDLNFHLSIGKASKNQFLAKILQTIRDMLHQFIVESLTIMGGSVNRSLNAHLEIFKAIQKHDTESAQREMRNHILNTERIAHEYYQYKEKGKK